MSNKQLFASHIYSRGLNYQRRGKVGKIRQSGNTYSANVRGSYNYRVSLTIFNGHVINMDCNCPYAESGSHCKHEAALYIELEEKGYMASQDQGTIVEYYNTIKNMYVEHTLNHYMHRYLNQHIKDIMQSKYSDTTMKIQKLIECAEEFSDLEIQSNHDDLLELIEVAFDKTANKSKATQNLFLGWISDSFIKGKNTVFYNFFHYYLDGLDPKVLFPYIEKTLPDISKKFSFTIDFHFALLIELLRANEISMEDALNITKNHKHSNGYPVLMIIKLMKQGSNEKAYARMMKYKTSFNEETKLILTPVELDLLYQLEKRQEFYEAILLHSSKLYLSILLNRIKQLKELYKNDWKIIYCDFFDALLNKVSPEDFNDIIIYLEEYEYAIYSIHNNPSFKQLDTYGQIIFKHSEEAYNYLWFKCISASASKIKGSDNFETIAYYIDSMADDFENKYTYLDVINQIKKDNPKNKELHQNLETYIERRNTNYEDFSY